MKTEDIDGYRPSQWVPMTDLPTLAALNKLQEELNELGKIIARILMQGIDEADPETGTINRSELEKEIADVRGLSKLVVDHFGLDDTCIEDRAEKKYNMKVKWLEMLTEGPKIINETDDFVDISMETEVVDKDGKPADLEHGS